MKRSVIWIVAFMLGGTIIWLVCFADLNHIGLKALSSFKTIRRAAIHLDDMRVSDQRYNHNTWTGLLQRHVNSSGAVNYMGFQKDTSALNDYLDTLSHHPPGPSWPRSEQLAYWINAYNAFTVQLILDHWPVTSIKDIGGDMPMINSAWDMKFFTIGGIDFDLNTIEHEILRKQFEEPRIHFAIVCASRSCPNLLDEAYEGDALDLQLDQQTRRFLSDPSKNLISSDQLALSQIFSWFKVDFTKEGSLKEFISRYMDADLSKTDIDYLEYDWRLND